MPKKIFGRSSKRNLQRKQGFDLIETVVYRTVFELPLNLWVRINITKDLKHLVKTGQLPTEELYVIWNNINDQYRELSKDTDSNYSFDLQKEIYTDDQDIIVIMMIVNRLRLRRIPGLIEILKNDFNFRFDYVDLNADLDRTVTVANGRLMQLKLKEKDYKELSGNQKTTETTEFDFIEQLVVLSEDNHYRIDIDQITVAEYIALYNKYKAKVQAYLERKQNA